MRVSADVAVTRFTSGVQLALMLIWVATASVCADVAVDADDELHVLPADSLAAQGPVPASIRGDVEDALIGPGAARLSAPPPVEFPGAEAQIGFLSPQRDEEWVEGAAVTLRWASSGPISQVRIYYYFDRCALGGKARGRFGALVTPMMPDRGSYQWAKVPWMDASGFRIRIAGYDAVGNLLASDERGVRFRPRELVGIPNNCVAVIKRQQRLYYYSGGRVQRMHIVSTGRFSGSTPNMRPGSHDRRRGAMGKVFRKAPSAWSRSYRVNMPYWLQITSSGSHGIHATSPRYYGRLGSPASAGCVRQHLSDAAKLYSLVSVGTPVYIF